MLSRDGEVKLLDLGLARFQFPSAESDDATANEWAEIGMTGTGQTMGTADYIAPEQVTDSRNVDVRADLYSLGCTLFKLLTGQPPFAGSEYPTAFAKMTAHVSAPPPSLHDRRSDAPAGLIKLVDRLLAKDPDKRPASADVVARSLEAFADADGLQRLVVEAQAKRPGDGAVRGEGQSAGKTRQPAGLRRRVPLSVAIAAGLLGIVIGFLCGITITIRKPDGSKISMVVPDGSDIEIGSTGEDDDLTGDDVRDQLPAESGHAVETEAIDEVEALRLAQGYWRVDQRQRDSAPEANGVDLVAILGDRMFLLENHQVVAAGTVQIEKAKPPYANRIKFLDVMNGQLIFGHIGIDRHSDRSMMLDHSTSIRNFESGPYRGTKDPRYFASVRYSTTRIPHSDVAEVETSLRSQLDDLGLGVPDERLSGVWRFVGPSWAAGDSRMLAFVVGFRGNEYFGVTPGTNPTRYHYRVDAAKRKLETYPAPVDNSSVSNQPSMFGTYELSSDGMLTMRVEQIHERDTEQVGTDAQSRNVQLRFERIGDFPKDRRELIALLRDQDRDVAMAMVHLFRAAGVEGADSGLTEETVQTADRQGETEKRLGSSAILVACGLASARFFQGSLRCPNVE